MNLIRYNQMNNIRWLGSILNFPSRSVITARLNLDVFLAFYGLLPVPSLIEAKLDPESKILR